MTMLNFLKKKPVPKPAKLRPDARASVHLPDGSTAVHNIRSWRLLETGALILYELDGQKGMCAIYPKGEWASVSIGKRAVSFGLMRARACLSDR
jgi:hypothetical protein